MPVNFVLGQYSYGDYPVGFGDWGRTGTISTGKFCSIGGNLNFMLNGNHRIDTFTSFPLHIMSCPVNSLPWGKSLPTIGNDVWIGMWVTIYSGVDIGDGAVIAGNSVVTKSVPPYAVVAGNPAKIVKYRFPPDVIEKLLKYKWWNFPFELIRNRIVPHYENITEAVSEMEKIYFELHPEEMPKETPPVEIEDIKPDDANILGKSENDE